MQVDVLHVVLAAIIVIIAFLNIRSENKHFAERKDLYDRIMAGSLDSYSAEASHESVPAGRNYIKKSIEKGKQEQGG